MASCRHLETKHRADFAGKHVLELGAGLGKLSVGIAKMGAHVTSTEAACQRPGLSFVLACLSVPHSTWLAHANITEISCENIAGDDIRQYLI